MQRLPEDLESTQNLSVKEAADFLDVSTQTLRRWDESGKLVPARTTGNQRRYTLSQLKSFRKELKKKKTRRLMEMTPVREAAVLMRAKQEEHYNGSSLRFDVLAQQLEAKAKQVEKTIRDEKQMPHFVHLSFQPFLAGVLLFLILCGGFLFFQMQPQSFERIASLFTHANTRTTLQSQVVSPSVLAAQFQTPDLLFAVSIPSLFRGQTTFAASISAQENVAIEKALQVNGLSTLAGGIVTNNQNIDAGTGSVTAANLLYGITAGQGIAVTTGQNPTISSTITQTSLQGQTGDLTLTAGSGISISGLTISSSLSVPNSFVNVLVNGQSDITAGSTNDSLTFVPGTGIVLTTNAGDKSLTIAESVNSITQWGNNGSSIYYNGGNVGIGTASPPGLLTVSGGESGGNAAFVVNQTGLGDIFAASSSGTTVARIDNSGNIIAGTYNGNTINSGTGTLSLNNGSTLLVNASATLSASLLQLANGGSLSLPDNQAVSFASSFSGGPNSLTLTTTGPTNITLPMSGTLLTTTATADQTITSTQQSGTLFGVTGATNITGSLTGVKISLSGTGSSMYNQTGLAFDLSGASGGQVNDIVGTNNSWFVTATGAASFQTVQTSALISSASITSSGLFLAANGSASQPSYSFTSSQDTGLYLPSVDNLGFVTGGVDRIRLTDTGQVGIGTATPTGLLSVSGQVAGQALVTINSTSTDQNLFVASSSGIAQFVISNNGTITAGAYQGSAIAAAYGGTGQSTYDLGDLLYASDTTALSRLPIGTSNGDVLIVQNGLPVWATVEGGPQGICTNCVITNPNSSVANLIIAGNSATTPLSLQAFSATQSADLFDVFASGSATKLFAIDHLGDISTGNWQGATISAAFGGTGLSSYNTGDLLYASAPNTLTTLPVGSSDGDVLTLQNGLPTWVLNTSGSVCANCVLNNPGATLGNTITATGSGVVALTLQEGAGINADILDIKDTSGNTTYAKFDQNGNLTLNNTTYLGNGTLYNLDNFGSSYFDIAKSDQVQTGLVNGNVIATGSGTLVLGAGKTFTANSSLTLNGVDNSVFTLNASATVSASMIHLSNGGSLSLAALQPVSFAGAFSTSGTYSATLTTTADTNVTLPTTGTLLTNTAGAGQSITSTQTSGTLLSLSDTTNTTGNMVGQSISLSGTGSNSQTGLQFNITGTGASLNDIVGTNNSWSVTNTGIASFTGMNVATTSGSFGWLQRQNGALSPTNITDDLLLGSMATSTATIAMSGTGVTTGNQLAINANSLTTGYGLNVTSTSNLLDTNGSLGYFYYNPGSATTSNGDVLDLNVGANASGVNGSIANIFNVMDNGSSDFSISQSQITANLPVQFTSPGSASFAYDINMTNPVASFITSAAALNLQSGQPFDSSNLVLSTFNAGNVIADTQAFFADQSATVAAQFVIGTSSPDAANIGNFYLTNDQTYGKSLAILNQTESQDILTGSNSATTEFRFDQNGNLSLAGVLQTNGLTPVAYNRIGTGTTNYGLSSANDLLVSGNLEVGGSLYAPSTGVSGYLQRNLGSLAPTNITDDLLLGSTSTGSALIKLTGTAGGNSFINTGNFGIGTNVPTALLTVNGGNTGGNAALIVNQTGASTNDIFSASSSGTTAFTIANNGDITQNSNETIGSANTLNANSVTTGNGLLLNANALTTGYGLNVTSTSNLLDVNGALGYFNYNPSVATTSNGDILDLNVGANASGANGSIANIFNVMDNGSSVFSVSQSQITANLPTQFTAPGGLSLAYDINMTNPTASFITSLAPLSLYAGAPFDSSDLTLGTYNSGNVIIDSQALQVNQAATVSGQLVVGALPPSGANFGQEYITNSQTYGMALETLDQYENADIFTASASGVPMFTIGYDGTITSGKYTTNGGLLYTNGSGVVQQVAQAGAQNLCLLSDSGELPVWGSCAAATNYWQYGMNGGNPNGTIAPVNISYDLLLGGASTSSATFAFINNALGLAAGNVPTASIAGNLALAVPTGINASSSINLLNGGSLGFYNSVGGNAGLSTTPALYIANNGRVGIGTNTPTALLDVNGAASVSGSLIFRGGAASILATQNSTLTLGGNATSNILFNQAGNVGIGTTSPNGLLTVSGGNTGGTAVGIFNQTGASSNDIFTASSSGNTKFIITNSGGVGINTGANNDALLAALDVRGISGTMPTASISANSSFAGLVVDNSGAGDLFTASMSGATRFTIGNNGDITQNSNETIGSANMLNANSVTTGNGLLLNANALTTGYGLNVTSTSNLLDVNGALGYFNYNPSVATTSNGDILDLNVGANASGANGSIANIFNVMDNGSSDFSVSQTQITANLPTQFTAPGGLSLAYDINMTNPTASFITSAAPLNIQAGDVFGNSNLTLSTFNSGAVEINSQALLVDQAASISGQLVVGTLTPPALFGQTYITNSQTYGAALFTLDQTESQDILTGSNSATTEFRFDQNGNLSLAGVLQTNGLTPVAYNRIGTGTTNYGLSSANDLLVSGNLEVAGNLYAPATGTSGYLQRNLGSLAPTNITDDLLLGSTATSTALIKFSGTAGGNSFINTGGGLSIGTAKTPLAALDVRGISGTMPTASISANSSFAGLVVDNSGTGDLFTASMSGATRFTIGNNGDITQNSNETIGSANTLNANSVTTGNGLLLNANALTTGYGLNVTSTSNLLDVNGALGYFNYNPSVATTSNGDILDLNVGANASGANGSIANIFNVMDNGSSDFSVSQTQITANLPTQFTAPGGLSLAYDINMTNPTASFITSLAPLNIYAGEQFGASNLTLGTYNNGTVEINSQSLTVDQAASISGQLTVGTTGADSANIGNLYVTNDQTYGKALAIFDQYENQDIFTASASGTPKFTIGYDGTITSGKYTTNGGLLYTNGSGVVQQVAQAGAQNLCLLSDSGELPVWGSCAAATNYWQYGMNGGNPNGTIAPVNISYDLLLGGASTSSATFAFINNALGLAAGNVPTASIAGNLALAVPTGINASSSINLLNGGSLGFYNSVGGNAGLSTTPALYISNTGTIGIGTNTPNALLNVSGGNTGGNALAIFNQTGASTNDIFAASASGTTKFRIDNSGDLATSGVLQTNGLTPVAYNRIGTGTTNYGLSSANDLLVSGNLEVAGNLYAPATGTSGYLQRNLGSLAPTNITDDLLLGSTATSTALIKFSGTAGGNSFINTGGGLSIGTAKTPLAALDVRGISGTMPTASISANSSFAGLVVDNSGTGDLFTASMSGATRFTIGNNGDITQNSNETIGSANTLNANSVTTGNGLLLNANALTTGYGLNVTSTSNLLDVNGALGYFNYNPSVATTSNGDILDLNVGANASGANGSIANIFNVMDNGSSVFSVSQSQITANLPLTLNTPGDLGVAYDLNLTNPDGSFINSSAPLSLVAGAPFDSSNLTLSTYNSGVVVIDSQALQVNQAASISGQLAVGTLTPPAFGQEYITNAQTYGMALETLDQYENADIFTASSSGVAKFTIGNDGTITSGKYTTGVAQFNASGVLSSTTLNLADNTNSVTGILGVTNGGTGLSSVATGNLLYASGTNTLSALAVGTNNQCLVSNGTVPVWGSCANASNYWQYGLTGGNPNGTISPINSSYDLLLGGTSTSSAAFAFINNALGLAAGNVPTASIAGNLALAVPTGANASSSINLLNNGSLGFYNSIGGNTGLSSTPALYIANNGAIGMGTTNPTSLLSVVGGNTGGNAAVIIQQTGSSNNDVIAASNSAGTVFRIDNSGNGWFNRVYVGNPSNDVYIFRGGGGILGVSGAISTSANSSLIFGTTNTSSYARINGNGNTIQFKNSNNTADASITAANGTFSGNVGIGTTTPNALLNVSGGNTGGNALAIFNQTGASTNDILTASSSGATKFTIANNGNITATGTLTGLTGLTSSGTINFSGLTANSGIYTDASSNLTSTIPTSGAIGYLQRNSGALAPTNISDDLLLGSTATSTALIKFSGTAGGNSFINTGNFGIGTNAPTALLTVNGGNTGGNAAAIINQTGAGTNDIFTASASGNTRFTIGNNGDITQNSTETIGSAFALNANSLTTGYGLNVTSTSNLLDVNGALGYFNYNPGSATTSNGDILDINVGANASGANGSIANIFNVMDNGSSVFSVSQSQITANLPLNLGASGDMGLAYDLSFTNPIGSNIKSSAPLSIYAGDVYNSSPLTLGTYNAGTVIVDSQALVANYAASISGQLTVGTTGADSANIGNLYVTNDQTYGKALAIFDQYENQDIFTASASGTPKFTIGYDGTLTSGKYTTGVAQFNASGVLSSTTLNLADYTNSVTGILHVANGGTGVSSFGGTNTLLYTTAANTLSSIPSVANAILTTDASGAPVWTTNPAASNSGSFGYLQRNLGALSPANITDDLLLGSAATSTALIKFSGTAGGNSFINTGNFGIGTNAPTSLLSVVGGNTGGNAAAIINQTGAGINDIFSASSSGHTKFTIANNGDVTTSGLINGQTISSAANFTGTGAFAGLLSANGGLTVPSGQNLTVSGLGTGVAQFNSSGVLSSGTVNLADSTYSVSGILPVANGGTGSSTAPYVTGSTDNTLTLSGTGPYTLGLNLNNANIWTAAQTFNVNTANAALTINNNGVGDLLTASKSGSTKFTVANNGDLTAAGMITGSSFAGAGTGLTGTASGLTAGSANAVTFNGGLTTTSSPSFAGLTLTGALDAGSNTVTSGLINGQTISSTANFTGTATFAGLLTANAGLTIPSGQNLTLSGNVASSLLPSVTNTYDLGSAANQWNNAYINNVYATAATISGLGTGVVQSTAGALSIGNVTNTELQNSSINLASDLGTGSVNLGGTYTVNGNASQGIATGLTGSTLTIAGLNASATQKGVASFGSNFSVTSGAVDLSLSGVTGGTYGGAGNGIGQFTVDAYGRITSASSRAVNLASSDVAGVLSVGNGGSPFTENLGSLSPKNITDDLLLGGTSTASALTKFSGTLGGSSYITAGNFGIGTKSAAFKLTVMDSLSATTAAITNFSSASNPVGLQLQLGYTTTTGNTGNHFINFLDGNGVLRGSIEANGSGVSYQVNGLSDFAEYMPKDPNSYIEFGSLMCSDGTGKVEACTASNSAMLGVASEHPSFLGGINQGDGSITVGYVGQIYTLVSDENGSIMPGDPITASGVPGIGVKATDKGQIIGHAVESLSCPQDSGLMTQDSSCTGKILVLVQPGWYDPSASGATEIATVAEPPANEIVPSPLVGEGQGEGLQGEVGTVSATLLSLQSQIDNLASQSAFMMSILQSPLLNDLIASGSGAFASVGNMDLQSATVSGSLQVLGRTTLSDLGVTGNITAGLLTVNGLDSSVCPGSPLLLGEGQGEVGCTAGVSLNTIGGPLALESDAVEPITLENNSVVIATDGSITTNGSITAKKINIDESDVAAASVGQGTILVGSSSATINTTSVTSDSHIFVTPRGSLAVPLTVSSTSAGLSFTVNSPAIQKKAVKFDWWIVN